MSSFLGNFHWRDGLPRWKDDLLHWRDKLPHWRDELLHWRDELPRVQRLALALPLLALLILFSSPLAFAQSLPDIGGGGKTTMKDYESISKEQIDLAKSELSSKSGYVKSNIKSWDGNGELWDNFRGSEDVQEAIDDDTEVITGDGFDECQKGEGQGHDKVTYDDMQFPGIQMSGTGPTDRPFITATGCRINWTRYIGFMNDGTTSPFGYCIKQEPANSFDCYLQGKPFNYTIYDIVDYWFPTAKIDVSEQPFQSLYLSKDEVMDYMPDIESFIEGEGAEQAAYALEKASGTVGKDASVDRAAAQKAIERLEVLRDDIVLSEGDDYLFFTAPHSKHAFARMVSEPVNLETLWLSWIPHIAKEVHFGNDFGEGYVQRMTLKDQDNYPLDYKYKKYFGSDHQQWACVGKDIETGKTPTDLLFGDIKDDARNAANSDGAGLLDVSLPVGTCMGTQPGTPADVPSKNLCLKDVGERFTLNSAGRLHITDRTFQGAAKVLDGFMANDAAKNSGTFGCTLMGGTCCPNDSTDDNHAFAPRHSYLESKDKWYVLRNDEFKQAIEEKKKQCKTLPEMLTTNHLFKRENEKKQIVSANIKEAKSGGEMTFELFTHFRGCWDANSGMGDPREMAGQGKRTKDGGNYGNFNYEQCGQKDGYKCRLH